MKDKKTLVLLVFFLAPAFLQAQTAAELDAVLESAAINCRDAAWFVYSSAAMEKTTEAEAASKTEAAPETAAIVVNSPAAAFEWAMNNGWLPKKAAPDDPIKLGSLSFLVMKAFNIKGGLLYRIFPGPR